MSRVILFKYPLLCVFGYDVIQDGDAEKQPDQQTRRSRRIPL